MKLYGKKPVLERIKRNPSTIRKLYLRERTDLSEIVREAKRTGLDFSSVGKKEFSKLCPSEVHSQGALAVVDDFEYAPFSSILEEAALGKRIPVFLDGITDPQNLGSIIRTLACLGGFSVVIPEYDSAKVNETVLRVACGGENHVPVAMIPNIAKGLADASKKGVTVIGASHSSGKDISGYEPASPIAIVIGSEGKGIRPGVLKNVDVELSLPMRGADLSYNAAVAAALFCYEITRQRSKDAIKRRA